MRLFGGAPYAVFIGDGVVIATSSQATSFFGE